MISTIRIHYGWSPQEASHYHNKDLLSDDLNNKGLYIADVHKRDSRIGDLNNKDFFIDDTIRIPQMMNSAIWNPLMTISTKSFHLLIILTIMIPM